MRLLYQISKVLMILAMLAPLSEGAERPTFNRDTCDPRPDILPYWLHDWYRDYRSVYNRPRYWTGRIAHAIEPTSQEAMVWCEANQMGLYNGRNCPPAFKQYYYPKPWEMLETGPRADFVRPDAFANSSTSQEDTAASADSSLSDQRKSPSMPEDTTSSRKRDNAEQPTTGKPTSLVKPARPFHFNGR